MQEEDLWWSDEEEEDFGPDPRLLIQGWWEGLVFHFGTWRYAPKPNPLKFMETARVKQGLGGARNKLQRMLDRRVWEHRSGRDFSELGIDRRMVSIYPASLFKGRPGVETTRKVCACGEVFSGRRGQTFCRAACRQKAHRDRNANL